MTSLKVIDIFPPQSIEVRPLCQATLSRYCVERNREWAAQRPEKVPRRIKEQLERGGSVEQCHCLARYKINGQYFCRKHGALKALDLVAEQVKP